MSVDGRRLGLSQKAATILEHIPFNEPVTSSQLSRRLPYNSRQIGATISNDLLRKYVTRQKGQNGWQYTRRT